MPRPAETATTFQDRQFVIALSRGLDVLACFTAREPELSVTAVARLTGLPQPTVWRLCHTLLARGFLTRVPGRDTMRPGVPLLGLGYAVLAGQPVAGLALPDMQAMADRYEGAVSLGARDGFAMIYLQRCQGQSIILDLRAGSRVPMAYSATGWAYLAGLPEAEREAILPALGGEEPARWQAAEPGLRQALRDFPATGFVVNKGMLHPRIHSVAAPVVSADGSVVLALSAGGIDTQFDDPTLRRLGGELVRLAAKLGPALAA